MKLCRKPQKNACKNALFLTFQGYTYKKEGKIMDLPGIINIFIKRFTPVRAVM
jgi:hypothetical protein